MPDNRELSSPLPRSRRVPPLAAAAFVFIVLVVFNFSNWRMMRYLERSKEEDLGRRLRSVSRVIADSLAVLEPPPVLETMDGQTTETRRATLDSYPDTDDYETLASRLSSYKQGSGLAQVLLLTPAGEVVADSNYRFVPGEPLPFAIDTQYLEAAVQGMPATTSLYEWEGELFERDYQPVKSADGRTLGVVMSSISPDYLQSMRQVRSQVFRVWVLSSVFVVLVGLWLYRTFRYVARLERRALQTVRVEAMGALAGGMAHELRNPLAIIRALSEEIVADQPHNNLTRENAKDIVAETQRLSELVTHFLSLSKSPISGELQDVSFTDEVQRVVQLMQKSAPETIRFIEDYPPDALHVTADPKALRQLLLNILVNAREAIGDQPGQIDITLRERRRQAELRIRDTGPGISRKEMARVFEPFYTTRSTGTGLGLALSRGIVENLGGELSLDSSPGKGTTAIITLPISGTNPNP